jgi:hypothetical protein
VVQEEPIDEHMVEERQRNGWARSKYRFGRDKQTTNRVYKTDRTILDRRLAVRDEAKASPLNAEHCGEFSLLVLNGWIAPFRTGSPVRVTFRLSRLLSAERSSIKSLEQNRMGLVLIVQDDGNC